MIAPAANELQRAHDVHILYAMGICADGLTRDGQINDAANPQRLHACAACLLNQFCV